MLAYDWNFLGLSTETKPLSGEKVVDGSTFYECDTSTFFIYYQDKWYQQTFVTENGINFWLYKTLMKKMFGKWFDSNITLAKIIKPTTGTEIEFTNSLPAQITDLTGYGNTFQQTYSGKNLWSFDTGTFTNNSGNNQTVTKTDNSLVLTADKTSGAQFVSWITPQMDDTKTYTISGKTKKIVKGTDGQSYIRVTYAYSDDGSNWSNNTNAYNNTSPTQGQEYSFNYTLESGHKYYRIRCYNNVSNPVTVGEQTTYYDLQLEQNDTATSYEPYVGGTASPNPDYPQDINVVTGEQNVWVHGKNCIDNNNLNYDFTNVSSTTQIELTSTSTGIQMNYTGSGSAPAVAFKLLDLTGYEGKTIRMSSTFTGQRIAIQNVNADLSNRDYSAYTNTSGETISWTVPNDLSTLGDRHYLAYYLRGSQGITSFNNLILTIDDSDMTFTPYQGQSYTVDLGSIELAKIGDYQDYIYKSGDDWYVHKEVEKVVLSGNENVGVNSTGTTSWYYAITNGYSNAAANAVISSHYIYNGSIAASNTIQGASITSGGTIRVRFGTEDTAANYKTWLTNNNVTLYYALATTTDAKITDTTLISNLNSLLNYIFPAGEHQIVITADALPMALKLTITEKE